MKRVIVMRHTKSDWSGTQVSDHDRILNARGRSSAASLGQWLRSNGLAPDQVLCSSSVRTRETLAHLDLSAEVKTTFTRDLYLATEDQMLAILRCATGDCVLLIGHNPGISACAENIVAVPPTHPQFSRYPTGATLVADLEIDNWSGAHWGKAKARHFVVPRDL